jgi:DNA-binding response OmpR family regulator
MPCILLVEDDLAVRSLVEEVLCDSGYEVDAESTVAGGLALLAARAYDLLLTDGRLPDGHGLTVAAKAKEIGVRVLVFTGYAHELPREQRESVTVLQKPVRMRELLGAITQSLNS